MVSKAYELEILGIDKGQGLLFAVLHVIGTDIMIRMDAPIADAELLRDIAERLTVAPRVTP